ncbi:putative xanthine dehydrogenase YagR molybdenum-binding subunit [Abditibacteriota bacterium]|nr:putative xanthine dehydrogenase YagR molybdenum-binding subunit [Abditibacteriota bacterium]
MEAIGKPLDRVDGRLKVTGAATYAAEFELPNMVHAALVQSGIGAGRVTSVDDSQARRLKGVLGVITFDNSPKISTPASRPASLTKPIFGGPEIEYNGQHIGVVVADTLERAFQGAEMVRFQYAAQKPRVELAEFKSEAFAPGNSRPSSRGDLNAGRASAAQIVTASYDVPTEHHNPMEPHATIAVWNGDALTVYDSSQGVEGCRRTLADTFNIPIENVRVICPFVGGGFGSKGTTWMHVPIAALAARTVGRPVKLVLRRQEMFSGHGYRSHTIQDMELGAQADGTLTITRNSTLNETSMSDDWREDTARMTGMMYACPNLEATGKIARLNKISPTYMRAPGEAAGSVGLECAMDELAAKLGMDPIEFRLHNDTQIDGSNKKPFSSRALKECLTLGRDKFGWSERKMEPGTLRQGRYLVGYGVAGGTYPANFRPSSARIMLMQNGAVLVQSSSHDLGTGAYTIFTQIAAEELGVPVDNVRVELGDTKLPDGVTAGGSATSASTGSAILNAAGELKKRLVSLATETKGSPLSGMAITEVKAENGRIFATNNPTKNLSYTDALKLAGQTSVEVTGSNGRAQRANLSYYSFGAQFSKVRVDLELGQIRVEKMLGVFGAGRILNAKTARSQMLGGMIWGIGMALHEHTQYDPNTARVVTRNLADYHIPCCADTPEIEVEFVPEEDTQMSPIGAKGIGELGIVGAAASIANAVYNATGKRIREFPLTPDKLV